MDFTEAFTMRAFQMFGLAFIFIPQNVLSYVGVPPEKNNQISSMNSFVRNIGGSIGIALISASISRVGTKHRAYLVGQTTPGSPAYEAMRQGLTQTLQNQGLNAADATHKSYALISGMISNQATVMAYVDVISVLALMVICLVPLVLVMQKPRLGKSDHVAAH
jgi:DHA2 family multidrug resistance protein